MNFQEHEPKFPSTFKFKNWLFNCTGQKVMKVYNTIFLNKHKHLEIRNKYVYKSSINKHHTHDSFGLQTRWNAINGI